MERVGVTMGMLQWFRVPQHSPPPRHRTIGVRGGWSTASQLRARKNGWAAGERVRRCTTRPPLKRERPREQLPQSSAERLARGSISKVCPFREGLHTRHGNSRSQGSR